MRSSTKHAAIITCFVLVGFLGFSQRPMPIGGDYAINWINELIEYDGKLVIAGKFWRVMDVQRANIVSWDGQMIYTMADAFDASNEHVYDVEIFNSDLIACGKEFDLDNIARWNGTSWSAMGNGFNAIVRSITVFNGELYAGGNFTTSGLDSVHYVAKWDGQSWVSVGQGLNSAVRALEVHNGELYAGGNFTADRSNTIELNHLARWNGVDWAPVQNGVSNYVELLHSSNGLLYGSGLFESDHDNNLDLFGGFQFNGVLNPVVFSGDTIKNPSRFYSDEYNNLYYSDQESTRSTGIVQFPHINVGRTRTVRNYDGHLIFGGTASYQSYELAHRLFKVDEGIDIGTLHVNNLRLSFQPWDMFYKVPVGYERVMDVPSLGGRHTIGYSGTWMLGFKDGDMYVDDEVWHDTACAGPVGLVYDQEYFERYFQIWHLNAQMIDEHINEWNDPGYELPYMIETWPGNGNSANNESLQLAPFEDLNGNGNYEPENGEFPLIRGDEALYYIYHNVKDPHFYNSSELGAEIHAMVYGFNMPWNSALHNTIFSNYKIINRSPIDYDSVKVGIHTWFDIGVQSNDAIASDPDLNMYYGYNTTSTDVSPNYPGFGNHPPAQGVKFLNHDLASHNRWVDMTWGMTFEDEFLCHMLGLEYFTFDPIEDSCAGEPYYLWSADPVTDTCGLSQYSYDVWSIGSTPWLPFNSGDTICLDNAYIFAQDTAGDNLTSITLLRQYAQEVQDWYDQQNPDCSGSYGWVTAVEENAEQSSIKLYPNPTGGILTIEGQFMGTAELELYSMTGRLVDKHILSGHAPKSTVDISAFKNGIYLVVLRTKDQLFTERLIKLSY